MYCFINLGARPSAYLILFLFLFLFLFLVFVLFCFVLFRFVFEAGFYYVALAVLELSLQTRLASNLQGFACRCLPSAGIKGMHHHVWPPI